MKGGVRARTLIAPLDPEVESQLRGLDLKRGEIARRYIRRDRGELDLLPYLESGWRAQLAHAVAYVGLIGALRRISGSSDDPTTGELP